MSLSINNNITSLNAWRNLKTTDSNLSKSMEKLSSGLRINRAADDPAGLVISEKMRAQLNGLDTAVKNSEKAINMVQTAEAALDKVGKLLVKIRQLAIDTANSGVNDTAMLAANQAELDEAVASITRIADYTQFGTKKLLNGDLGASVTEAAGTLGEGATFDLASTVMAGEDGKAVSLRLDQQATRGALKFNITSGGAAGTITVDGQIFSVSSTAKSTDVETALEANATVAARYTVAVSGTNIILTNKQAWGTEQDLASVTLATAGAAAGTVSAGIAGQDIQASLYVDGTLVGNMDAGTGLQLRDATGNVITVTSTANAAASEGVTATVGTIDDNAAVFQVGANESQTISVGIQSTKATALGRSALYDDSDGNLDQRVTTFVSLDTLTSSAAVVTGGVFKGGTADQIAEAVGVIDKAIEDIATLRGDLGAVQSDNLQVQLDSLRVSYENLQASESTIRDADMTSEMATFTKYQIMLQAGTAMLAQANQMPQSILQLLQ